METSSIWSSTRCRMKWMISLPTTNTPAKVVTTWESSWLTEMMNCASCTRKATFRRTSSRMVSRKSERKKRKFAWLSLKRRNVKDSWTWFVSRSPKFPRWQKKWSDSMKSSTLRRKKFRSWVKLLKTLKSTRTLTISKAKTQIRKLCLPKSTFWRNDWTTRRKLYWKRSLSTKKWAIWLKGWELRLWTGEKRPLKSQRRSTSIRRAQLNCLVKCSPQSPNFLCSSRKRSSSSKKRKKRSRFWSRLWTTWTRKCPPQKTQSTNGIACYATSNAASRSLRNVRRGRPSMRK